MTAKELRKKYIEFFKSKGHALIPSASLVPQNDPTVLFTTAGMHPLVPYLLGEPHPGGNRLVSVQKSLRTDDIEEVGDNVHNTFFEMLGNWSLGDYWKKEAIGWSYEFLTDKKWLGIDPAVFGISIFGGDDDSPRDDESAQIWKSLGIPDERIAYLGKEDNWWGPAGVTGPCGPDTEMFIRTGRGEAPKNFDPKDGDWVEVWNDVFMEYNKTINGSHAPLLQQNVDTGMGLERMLMVLQKKESVYETELFEPIIEKIRGLAKKQDTKAERIVADHIRAATFIIADGVVPSNKDRGYVLRRLVRRAIRYGQILGIAEEFAAEIGSVVVESFHDIYPELKVHREKIANELGKEDIRFRKTLDKGLREFEKLGQIDGKKAFDLFQTYGFPWELTRELSENKGQMVNQEEFEGEFKKHQELSRTAGAGVFKGGLQDHTEEVVRLHTSTHLLQAALRKVLGNHVFQKGSNITKERTRFDFAHPQKLTPEEIKKVEDLVNAWIEKDYSVKKEMMPLEEARRLGAIGLFGEKYGEQVSVYTICDSAANEVISREFCGGPHVEHTGVIGKFKIVKEESVASGVRRIKATVE
ncbi:MAG: alanine--tRNA ligase [Candidatus Doudnabacteria bacterium]|nr:alanine--tRNA ligase [bacterium]MDZ4244158.1 alanine--tRNA ligase [Candidatus Doudnabacteria bacterium]